MGRLVPPFETCRASFFKPNAAQEGRPRKPQSRICGALLGRRGEGGRREEEENEGEGRDTLHTMLEHVIHGYMHSNASR